MDGDIFTGLLHTEAVATEAIIEGRDVERFFAAEAGVALIVFFRLSQCINVSLLEGVVDFGKGGDDVVVAVIAYVKRDRIEDVAEHTWHGEHVNTLHLHAHEATAFLR